MNKIKPHLFLLILYIAFIVHFIQQYVEFFANVFCSPLLYCICKYSFCDCILVTVLEFLGQFEALENYTFGSNFFYTLFL